MAEQRPQMVNPMLALTQLYIKDGKSHKDVIGDIITHLNTLGMELTDEYVKKNVLPFIFSLLFMTTCQQMLDEYIAALSKVSARTPAPGKPPVPKPANI